MASGWIIWLWLGCIGVVIIIITFLFSTCISSFFASSIPISLFILKMFFVLVYVIFVKYIANVAQRTFEIVQKSRSARNNIINYMKVERMSTARARESRDFHVRGTGDVLIKLQLSLCTIMAS